MAKSKRDILKYRRRREGRTDYKRRLNYLIGGKIRLVVRKSLRYINVQFVKYDTKGDIILASANSIELRKIGWNYSCNNIPSAYLVGLLAGKRAVEKGVKEAILDIGLNVTVHSGILYSVLKGVLDKGIMVPANLKVLPNEDIVSGKNIADYAEKLLKNDSAYKKQFSNYLKKNLNPSNIVKDFEVVRNKLK